MSTTRRRNVMFESWRGRYADSPRAIFERLATLQLSVQPLWVAPTTVSLPPGTARVERHSPKYFARLFTTDVLITNDIVSKHIIKGPGVTYVQCWHGTPLKTIGFDEHAPKYSGAKAHRRRMVRDVAKWDYLVSPSETCTRIFRQAFRYEGRVLETGYPRNDILRHPDALAIRRRVRAQLGLEEGALGVLYAPTWRDDSKGGDGAFRDPGGIDVHLLSAHLPEGSLLMSRMHNVVRSGPALDGITNAVDVSEHPDIAELYLAADVLVSDYSSAIFDFAVTGKPIVLFPYDLDHYCGARELYFDYASWAPGPIVQTTEALADTLLRLDSLTPVHAQRYRDFVEKFCPHEDGHAADRVIAAVFT